MAQLETEETPSLISSEKVEGTAVYGSDGEKLGHVSSVMLDKRSGRVAYAVMSFGGVLGIGEKYHPLPWDVLDYDTGKGGYVVNLSNDQLQSAPMFGRGEEDRLLDRSYEDSIHRHYGIEPYWI